MTDQGAWHKRLYKPDQPRRAPLTFCVSCALKRFENLWNVPSLIFYTEFSLLGSSY